MTPLAGTLTPALTEALRAWQAVHGALPPDLYGPAAPGQIAAWLEAQQAGRLSRTERKRQGRFGTPPEIVHQVLDTIAPWLDAPAGTLRMLEPAAGCGTFAAAFAGLAASHHWTPAITLVELDPLAGQLAQSLTAALLPAGVPEPTLHSGDFLLDDLGLVPDSFDLVLGNPPYIAAYAKGAHPLTPEERAALRERYRFAQGRVNSAVCFIERGLELLRPGGLLAFVLPSAIFHMHTWRTLRRWLLTEHTVRWARYCGEGHFAAEVPAGILAIRKGRTQPGLSIRIERTLPLAAAQLAPADLLASPSVIFTPHRHAGTSRFLAAMERDSIPLGELVEIRDGINPGNRRAALVADAQVTPQHRRVLAGRDISPWQIRWGGQWVWYDPAGIAALKAEGGYAFLREAWLFDAPVKLVHRQTADRLIAALDTGGRYCCLNSCHLTIPKVPLEQLTVPGPGPLSDAALAPYADPLLLCALYNSGPLNRYYQLVYCETEATYPQVKTVNLRRLPVPRLPLEVRIAILEQATLLASAPLPAMATATQARIDQLLGGALGIPWPVA